MILPGYEPKGLTTAMFSRRRATQAELDQGMDEMLRAQQRVEAEVATGSEKPIEDVKGLETVVPESPKSSAKEESLGREEGPRSFLPHLCLPFLDRKSLK